MRSWIIEVTGKVRLFEPREILWAGFERHLDRMAHR